MSLIDIVKASLDLDKRRLPHYERMAATSVEGRLNSKWDHRRSRVYYYLQKPEDDREHSIPTEPNARVWKLQCKHFAEQMIRILRNNIAAKEQFVESLLSDDTAEVLESMPRAYRPNSSFRPRSRSGRSEDDDSRGIRNDRPRQKIPQSENPYKPEELNIQTSFGLWVRSKGELFIAELLYSLGIEFFYERALVLDVYRVDENTGESYWTTKTYYPDFTILLPDGRIYYWEHKGMLSSLQYVMRDARKSFDYNTNGIFQPYNLIVTEEGPNNKIDVDGIHAVVRFLL